MSALKKELQSGHPVKRELAVPLLASPLPHRQLGRFNELDLGAVEAALEANEAMRHKMRSMKEVGRFSSVAPPPSKEVRIETAQTLGGTCGMEQVFAAARQKLHEKFGDLDGGSNQTTGKDSNTEEGDPRWLSARERAQLEQERNFAVPTSAGVRMSSLVASTEGMSNVRAALSIELEKGREREKESDARRAARDSPQGSSQNSPQGGVLNKAGESAACHVKELEAKLQDRDSQIASLQQQLKEAKSEVAVVISKSEDIAREALQEQAEELETLKSKLKRTTEALETERHHLNFALEKLGVRDLTVS